MTDLPAWRLRDKVDLSVWADYLEDRGLSDAPFLEKLRAGMFPGPMGSWFSLLPRGTFYMGDGGKPSTKTEIKEAFKIAVHTVTQSQWQAVMGTNPSWFSRTGDGSNAVKDISDDELKLFPVESVSWNDVQEFIRKLNAQEQKRGSGYVCRLPTEAEWEYACRGGVTSPEECAYHFYFDKPTNDLSSKQANFDGNYPFGKVNKGPYLARPTKVGLYAPNKLGLYDMHGNVWEWCDVSDLYEPGNPVRVLRGGSWYTDGENCRSALRGRLGPDSRYQGCGFRLVVSDVP